MKLMLDLAVQLALSAGALLKERFISRDRLDIRSKGRRNIVTQADVDAENLIRGGIVAARPSDKIVGEELESRAGSEIVWHIDPLDGTSNFAHGIPHWSVSIAACDTAGPVVGVIFDPLRNELFTASRGGGARCNDRALTIAPKENLASSLIATEFAFMRRDNPDDACLDLFRDVILNVQGVRRLGSATLDLAYVASSRVELFYEEELATWDMAAGALIVTEAGGAVVDFDGTPRHLESGRIIAGAPRLVSEFIERFRP